MKEELKGNYRNVFYGTKTINLLVIRIDKYGNYCSSRPCSSCLKFMKTIDGLKISKVYYFDTNGKFICEKLKDMKSEHTSLGYRTIKI